VLFTPLKKHQKKGGKASNGGAYRGVLEAKFCLHLFLTKQGEGSPSATSNQTPQTKGNPYRGKLYYQMSFNTT